MDKRLLLIGGGGHCRSVLDSALASGEYAKIGIIDKTTELIIPGIEVVGNDDDLPTLHDGGWEYAFITVGSVGNTSLRHRLYELAAEIGFKIPTIIDPSAVIARDVEIGQGCFIGKGAIVNSGCSIGNCAIINTGAIVEHECRIGDFVHISPGAVLCGQVTVGNDTHVGAGSTIRQQIAVGKETLIGAGSVVVSSLDDNVKAYGNPCKVVY